MRTNGAGRRSGARGKLRHEMERSAGALARWVSGPGAHDDSPRARQLLRLVDSHDAGGEEGEGADRVASRLFGRNQMVIYKGASWRLCPDGSLRRWDAAAQRWESIWRDHWSHDEATFVGGAPDLAVGSEAATRTEDEWRAVDGCTSLGGSLPELCLYGKYTLVFRLDGIKMLSHQAGVVEIPWDDVVDVELSGRGRVAGTAASLENLGLDTADPSTTEEMASTTVVRSLVTRSGMDTSIRVETRAGEAFFHCDCETPDELRRSLRFFLKRLPATSGEAVVERGGVAGQLLDLADLKSRGLLTDEEFAAAKAAVLRGS